MISESKEIVLESGEVIIQYGAQVESRRIMHAKS